MQTDRWHLRPQRQKVGTLLEAGTVESDRECREMHEMHEWHDRRMGG